ncbi:MAG TPA: gliding motility protein GldN [Chitinophagaceae bacterium]|jgi:gliding motility associated protien GldN|nr:gliding motility protein GldN [Chitinophagaceae bacterium]
MKRILFKSGMCLLLAALFSSQLDAQRRSNRRGAQPTTNPTTQQTNINQQPGYDPYGGLPITIDSSGVSDTVLRKSLRNDNAFDKSGLNTRTPLQYEHLRWDDALYAHKVWRELDLREKMNQTFRYEAQDDNGSQLFIDMLLKAVNSGEVTAFSDDRFTTPMSVTDIQQLTVGKADTTPVYDIKELDKITGYKVTRASFDAKSVTKLRLKEEWVFDREASRLFCRILGVAALKTEYIPNTTRERGTSTMFWVYYPDIRPMLAKAEVYNPKNMGQNRLTWEELFESRMFSSYIVKSTIDNASNKNVRNIYKDPILALLEGDNIKEKIFNYEQDLWSY